MTDKTMTRLADILKTLFLETLFAPVPCDLCTDFDNDRAVKLCYTDPETGCRYCLPCLELSTDTGENKSWEELPPDPAIMQMGREIVYAPR